MSTHFELFVAFGPDFFFLMENVAQIYGVE